VTAGFRFGLQAARLLEPQPWRDLAQRAEADGFHSLMIPDHLARLSTFPALMAAAAVTRTIELATYVLNQDFRPVGILAQEAASVHLFTDGRLVLGIGGGWAPGEYTQTGLTFDPGPVRIARFDEYIQVIKGLLNAATPYSFDGEFFTLRDFQPLPRTPGKPPPRILIGGGSPKILTTAGKYADIISISTRATPDGRVDSRNVRASAVDQKLEAIQRAAGGRMPEIELNMTVREVRVTSDRRAGAESILSAWSSMPQRMAHADSLSVEDLLDSPHVAIGTPDQIAEQYLRYRERWGITYFQIGSPDAEAMAPVIARLTSASIAAAR
jgi:probable F420-dependent oxidoreductase